MSPITSVDDIERFGLTEVYSCDQPNADIVFVHGLNGHPQRTWTSQTTGSFWPRDLLPADFESDRKARVLVYGYDADVTSTSKGVSKDKIHNHAELLVAYLVANRRRQRAEQRPIVFIAHSLGGLVVKRALIYSSSVEVGSRIERLRSVFLSTHGIVFMGTPHHGSDLATWGSYLERLASAVLPKKLLDTSDQLIDALKSDSETLVNIDRGFMNIMSRFHIYYFHEAKPMDVKGTLRFVVDEDSAAPTLPDVERAGIQSDHSHMCKFDSVNSPGYVLVSEAITTYIEEEAEQHPVAQNWLMERRQRMIVHGGITSVGLNMQPEISEPSSRRGSSSQMEIESNQISMRLLENPSNEQYFFVPPGFRENLVFVGMRRQLEDIDTKLFDPQRRQTSTASILIYGPPGAGKSHLARQYIYKNRKRFPGGIFWIKARHSDEMRKDLWEIAQRFIAEDSPGIRIEPSGRGKRLESTIWEWFNSRDEWLVVLDGVVVDRKQDVELLQNSIPSKANTSLIYTSRSSQFQLSHRLMNPRPIRVPPLSAEEGQELIFEEVGAKRTAGNQKAAKDIVHKVGGLPLALHVISVRLVSTREPLEAYRIRSWMDDDKLGGPFRAILKDLGECYPGAYNLINILSFFGPHIPVELIRLGIRGIRASGLSINNSIGYGTMSGINSSLSILMQNALVERNEDDTDPSTPTNSSKSTLTESEPMDMLRLHTVVQKFCRDRLDRGADPALKLPQWIDLASKLLIRSYHEACQIMNDRQKDYPPRVSDYREYLLHTKEMREHSITYAHKSQPLDQVRSALEDLLAEVEYQIKDLEPRSSQSSVYITKSSPSVFDRFSTTSSSSFTSDDESPSISGQEKLRSLGYEREITDSEVPLRSSPTDHRAPPLYDGSIPRGAMEMLRSISDSERTVRPPSVMSDEIESISEPKHVRTTSLPIIRGSSGVFPSAIRPHTAVAIGDAEARFALWTVSKPETTVVNSAAVSQLTSAYNRPLLLPGTVQKNGLRSQLSPSETEVLIQGRLHPQRLPSTGSLAPPLLTTQDSPNLFADPFHPSEYPADSIAGRNCDGSKLSTQPAESSNWNEPLTYLRGDRVEVPRTNQSQAIYQPSSMYVIHQPQVQTSRSPDTMASRSTIQRYQLVPIPGYSSIINADHPSHSQNYRHERAASAPDISGQLSEDNLVDSFRRASELSFTSDWSHQYGQPSPQRSSQSHICNHFEQGVPLRSEVVRSELDTIHPFSAPHFQSPFAPPPHLNPQAATGYPTSSPPLAFQTPKSSPLQMVQNAYDVPSPRSLSPLRSGQSGTRTSSPPPNQIGDIDIRCTEENGPRYRSNKMPLQAPVPSLDRLTGYPNTGRLQRIGAQFRATDTPLSVSPPTAPNMSRLGSAPGPGIAVPGLGITEFGGNGHVMTSADTIAFGQQEPVNLVEAKRRSLAREIKNQPERAEPFPKDVHQASNIVMDQAEWGAHSEMTPRPKSWRSIDPSSSVPKIQGPAPYPDINQMPAETDAGELQAMLEELSASRALSPSVSQIGIYQTNSRTRAQSEPHIETAFQPHP